VTLPKGQRVLGFTFLATLAFCVLEFVGGKLSGSLALTADASHMLTDLGALGLALFANWMAAKSPTRKMTYGFYRIEILSALVNGAALLTISVFIVVEAFHRFHQKVPLENPQLMLVIAFAGFIFNLVTGFLLSRSAHENINVRAAFFHIVSDTISSAGTLLAGIVIIKTGRYEADPIISFFIAGLIVLSAYRLLKDVVEVLLEAAPAHIDVEKVEKDILSVTGITALHDLHVWSITSGKEALSAHLQVTPGMNADQILDHVNAVLLKNFNIEHTTLQIEFGDQRKDSLHCEH
jgi:cobalt-zinc-cadmium efflux system protein